MTPLDYQMSWLQMIGRCRREFPFAHEGSPVIVYRFVPPVSEVDRHYCLALARFWLSVTPEGL